MENWNACFVPECFFDTILFKKILQTNKRLKHTKGCFNVVNRFREIKGKKGDLFDSPFGLGMVDKDKREFDFLKEECDDKGKIELPMLLVWKHKMRNHYIIQLEPPLEKWLIKILDDSKLRIEDFGYSRNYQKLKNEIKSDIDGENDENLNKLVSTFVSLNHPVVKNLKTILLYFKEKTIEADIEELKKIVCN
jgi:hypothetical protein